MHEIGIVDDVLRAINAKLKGSKENPAVKQVNIAIGELEHISPGHFEFHFRERTKGTFLENAKLNFRKVGARFKCRQCHFEFSGDETLEGCPKCKSKVNELIEGAGISVDSVEMI
ncbi:MAG: hydrogenase maturation nickel metallochaperone HypA [Candidatus Omnitrophica bacterium]|nr:hydrogenase maturation nickel metallochaperone HypA [Candidatus Omnitrophota bacterium]